MPAFSNPQKKKKKNKLNSLFTEEMVIKVIRSGRLKNHPAG